MIMLMPYIMHADDTAAGDQLIRFPPSGGNTKYCFSLWAFPEHMFPQLTRDYFEFCADYYKQHGYRCNMLNVGYRIDQDDSSLFSYSYDGIVMTVDPVATGTTAGRTSSRRTTSGAAHGAGAHCSTRHAG